MEWKKKAYIVWTVVADSKDKPISVKKMEFWEFFDGSLSE